MLFRSKGWGKKHFNKKLHNRRVRGKLHKWHGRRMRCLRLGSRHLSKTDKEHPERGRGFDKMEMDVDMATGVPLETRLYDKKGHCFQKTKVLGTTRCPVTGCVLPTETETESDAVGGLFKQRQKHKERVLNKVMTAEDMRLEIPAEFKKAEADSDKKQKEFLGLKL